MRLCWKSPDGKNSNCVTLPGWPPPFPNQVGGRHLIEKSQEPGVYSELFIDASIINALQDVTKGISDGASRKAVSAGIKAAVAALQKRVGDSVSISLE